MAPPRVLKSTARRLHKVSGLTDRLRLAFTDCLGPCSEANVMLLYLRGRPIWFRRMNAPELLEALLTYARGVVDGNAPPLPAELALRSFSWTGVGLGPEPPIADAEPGQGAV
jgi:(2Fe-2S) ferredoxin